MPIITLSQAKTLLQITASTYDSLLGLFIPRVQKTIVSYCRNSFINPNVQMRSSGIAFVISTDATPVYSITDSDSSFLDNYLIPGDYKFSGSVYNDGIYAISGVAAGTLISSDSLVANEDLGETITITKVEFPQEIQIETATYLKYLMTLQGKLVNSESLPGGYSVQFKSEREVLSIFNKYRKPYK